MTRTVQEIFENVVELSEEQRFCELNRRCGTDAKLRAEVESLLIAYDGAGEFLANPTIQPIQLNATASMESTSGTERMLAEGPGKFVDRYKLLEKIGEGGFGVVYMAQQTEPIRRRVALKIIKLGMDTRQVVARFEAERQALAVMDHPNVARVIDGGSTETGRPYFVMELVRGESIIPYCDQNKLSLQGRLELFQQVCRAIAHAHQKGIIHRDIKPSNVLVTIADDKPMVKVIDFGIAKATTAQLTDKTLFTEFRQLIGTPLYMSPEQAQRSGVDIDTRTDIYSLGVLLYEMLTGRTPLDPRKMNSAAWAELQRMIIEDEPSRPSIAVSAQDSNLAELARLRGILPSRLGTFLRGDLDWIVLKAIDKDRSRRYGTVAALNDDIDRFLRGDTVDATPPSKTYRFRKFVSRYRRWLGMASALLLMLIVGLATTSVTASWAMRSEQKAREALALAKENERRALRAVTLASASVTLPESEARTLSKSWLDDITAAELKTPQNTNELARQKVQHAAWFGSWLLRNGHVEEAASLIDKNYAIAKAQFATNDPTRLELCNAKVQLVELRLQSPNFDSEEYAECYSELVESVRQVRGIDESTQLLPNYAAALVKAGRSTEAEDIVARYVAARRDSIGPLSPGENGRLDSAIDRLMNWGGIDMDGKPKPILVSLRSVRESGRQSFSEPDTTNDEELASDLGSMQGKWRYKGWQQGKLTEHMIVEIVGHKSQTRFLDEAGNTIRGRSTRIELSRSGGVKLFKSFSGDAPTVGGSFVYEIEPHRLVLVSGLLQNEASLPEIKLRNFYRMKPGETDLGTDDN